MSLKKIKLLVSYDGTDFCGWQKQKDYNRGPKRPSIQETLENALINIFQEPISVSASGRTDAGVHALGQVCHFETTKKMPQDLCWALKSQLPSSIVVKQAWLAPKKFHSTLSATRKTYRYFIWNNQRPSALLTRYSWWVRKPLDIKALENLSQVLIGEHDFSSFQSQGTPVPHTIRTIYQIQWSYKSPSLIEFRIVGSGFLKQMVRNIVGTLVDSHLKNKDSLFIENILKAHDRKKAGLTAPPQGLFLLKVYYPKALDRSCLKI